MLHDTCVIFIVLTILTNGQILLPHPNRCWYVHTSGEQLDGEILAMLQQSYSPLILINEEDDGNSTTNLIEKCDGFIYIKENCKDILKSINVAEIQNTKVLLIYFSDVDCVLEDSVQKHMHSKSLNVLMIRILHIKSIVPRNILSFEHPFYNLSVTAPFINKTLTVTTKDVNAIDHLFKLQKWRPDFSASLNITFHVGINKLIPCSPLIINELTNTDGIELRIIEEVSRRWKIEYHSIPIGESALRDYAVDSLIEEVIDISTCTYPGLFEGVDVSYAYAKVCGTFLVPKSLPVNPSEYLVLPLSAIVWISIAVFSVMAFLSMYLITVIGNKLDVSQWTNSPYQSLTTCMWNTFSILTSQGAAVCPNQNSLRVFIMAWILVCLLVGYCTGYASLLTYPRFTKKINTLEDMIDQDIYWGSDRSLTNTMMRLIHDKYIFTPEIARAFKPELTDYDRLERLQGRHYALNIINFKNTFASGIEGLRNVSRDLVVLRECYTESYRMYNFRKNSPYTEIFNDKIHKVVESGIIDSWLTDISVKYNFSYMKHLFSHTVAPNDAAPLTLDDLQGAFYLLCVGLTLSAAVFLFEKWMNNRFIRGEEEVRHQIHPYIC